MPSKSPKQARTHRRRAAAHDKGFAEENEHSVQKVAREFLSRPTSASRQKSKK